MIFFGSAIKASNHFGSLHALSKESVFKTLFQLHDLNIIFVSNSCNFLQMGIFEDSVGLSKKVIDDKDTLLPSS